ncbi:MAG: 4'-phosphopantetheinyl transferase superfamily protein [Clostridiales bacterium]|nr:4'-phosphopantetheinyl transferase superfamily protein [Clostridiales bacterium]
MKWVVTAPQAGDMVRVKVNELYHYGIYVSSKEIIQFGLSPILRTTNNDNEIEVCFSDEKTFLCGGTFEVGIFDKSNEKKRTCAEIIDYARSKIGQKGYNILYNNCEHFAYDCVTGQKLCSQTEEVRKVFRAVPIVDVYTAVIPKDAKLSNLYPKERQQDIDACSNERVKKEKYYAWKLLEYALKDKYSLNICDVNFEKSKAGKWTCDKCYFSISHSSDVVAVAVSDSAVGIDVEQNDNVKENAIIKVLTNSELKQFDVIKNDDRISFLLTKWVQKESIFKAGKEQKFLPSKIDTTLYSVKIKNLNVFAKEYILGVCSIPNGIMRFHENVIL